MHNISLYFPKLDIQKIKVRCYGDASFGKLADGGSQGGMYIELISSQNKSAPIAWQSKRICRVVNNIMSAETLAMKDALDTGFLVKYLLDELLYEGKNKVPIEGLTDSKALHEASHSTTSVQDRRLRIDLSIIREYILNEKCKLSWVESGDQLADILTKEGVDSLKILSHISRN